MNLFKQFTRYYLLNTFLFISIFLIYICIGLYLSKESIPNQEGYFELSWNLIYINFEKFITAPNVTPLIFLISAAIHKTLNISLSSSWKIMDLIFSGFSLLFLTFIYWQEQKPKKIFEKLIPALLIFTSVGFVYSFTSGSGEGLPTFFALAGVYFWQKRKFEIAVLIFAISYLSKYTMYLIAPGLLVWTLLNFRNYQKKEIIRIFISGFFLLLFAIFYLSFKNWGDLALQIPYIDDFSVAKASHYFYFYFFVFLVGAPIVAIFYFLKPSVNIFWIIALSAFIMLIRRYFYWNHSQQIIIFALAYVLTHKEASKFLNFKTLTLQFIFAISILSILPIYSYNLPLFHKHITTEESKLIETEIYKDYHGGRVGYYLNRRFDEPFAAYEISYMGTSSKSLIEDTEYVVIPTVSGIPSQLLSYTECKYTFYEQVQQNTIYKVQCTENEK